MMHPQIPSLWLSNMSDVILIPRRTLALAVLLTLAFGFDTGALLGARSGYAKGVQAGETTALHAAQAQALLQVQGEMQKACSTWFNDKRSKKPVGRLVVCHAPAFMNLPANNQ